ncbi:VOC family protein [Rhodococcus sp. DMU1]|uniref:VOC family protein n=1 Tax=Rhodococcus sp. DMU1 TaxID=2722825 RepID=UPI00143E6D0C|nr:VOC family protein [Rhodococcus sp. DMU1]QIX52667.1 VOC family protein [Rhodococcus sp. DMU1]
MRAADLFHLGIVTADFDATRDELTGLFGYDWGLETGAAVSVVTPAGDTVVELRCAFSVTEPRIEIVCGVPDTLWAPTAGIHHLGYWSEDVAADAEGLARTGYSVEARRVAPDGRPAFAFLRSSTGLLVELVDRAIEPGLSQCWATPAVDGGVA